MLFLSVQIRRRAELRERFDDAVALKSGIDRRRAPLDAVLAGALTGPELDELRQAFRPEFLNRVDEIVVFHALSEQHLKQIVEIQLARLRKRLEERHITFLSMQRSMYVAGQRTVCYQGADVRGRRSPNGDVQL